MSKHVYERRVLATEFETRTAGDNLIIEGYALKWNTRSQNLGGFREEVAVGATTKTIGEADIRALVNHDPNLILGRSKGGQGTLRLSEDSTGLHYEVEADLRQSYARDLAIAMERGDVTQSSFGFRMIDDDWSLDESDFPLRTLRQIALHDVSPVTYPAYTDSTSGVSQGRSAVQAFCESRGIDYDAAVDLAAVLRGDALEPDPVEEPQAPSAEETTQLVLPDPAFELGIRARLLGLSEGR